MKLTFLGSGNSSCLRSENYHSNMLLAADNGNKLLIDCGSDARNSLDELGFTHRDITDVYISHIHDDHSGGLEWLGFVSRFDPEYTSKPRLYLSDQLSIPLWENKLRGGLSSIQCELVTLDSFFEVNKIPSNGGFSWENTHFQLVQTVHAMDGYSLIPSHGLLFNFNGKTVFITTDTQFGPNQIHDVYATADLIFQDCEIAPHKSGVHAHFEELCTLSDPVKSKMWLYHYGSTPLPDAKGNGFLGFVKKGQVFQ